MAFINNYSTLSKERHKKISNILSNTETNRNALVPVCSFQQTYLVKPPQILQPVALLMFRVEVIQMFLPVVPIQICQAKFLWISSVCWNKWLIFLFFSTLPRLHKTCSNRRCVMFTICAHLWASYTHIGRMRYKLMCFHIYEKHIKYIYFRF